jgi:hypothetical protein
MKRLMLLSLLLLSACGGTRTEILEPEPCYVEPFPVFPDDAGFVTPQEKAVTAAWMVNVADWADSVRDCPYIKESADGVEGR